MKKFHFSHEHPLNQIEQYLEDGDHQEVECSGCRKQISAAAHDIYSCTITSCNFFLHKACAEVAQEIKYPMHNRHPLVLHARPPYENMNFKCECNTCNREWDGFTYICDRCKWNVCLVCAMEDGEIIYHQGHKKKQHALRLVQRKASLTCDACASAYNDFSYTCKSCPFWIHKTCATAPTTLNDPTIHHHSLLLAYSVPHEFRKFPKLCGVCNRKVILSHWSYFCQICAFFVHLSCATCRSSIPGGKDEEVLKVEYSCEELANMTHRPLPNRGSMIDAIIKQFKELLMIHHQQPQILGTIHDHNSTSTSTSSTIFTGLEPIIFHMSHQQHPLRLVDQQEVLERNYISTDYKNEIVNIDDELICDGCVMPIITSTSTSPPISFYGCTRCKFFLYTFCAQLPNSIRLGPGASTSCHYPQQHPLTLFKFPKTYHLNYCELCGCKTNGLLYVCIPCKYAIDVGCLMVPNNPIKHEAHNHPLVIQYYCQDDTKERKKGCSACGFFFSSKIHFGCETCPDYNLDIRCALHFPETIRHRWDPHPIRLMYPPFYDHGGIVYCEICEEEINLLLWIYRCELCDQSFHPICLLGSQNYKTGGTLVALGTHPHPLTFVQKRVPLEEEDAHTSSSCSICGCKIQNFSAILECLACDFLLCTLCAYSRNV